MNIDLNRCVRLSPNARIKIMKEFFPVTSEEYTGNNLTDAELAMHAGALCLYASTMLTKIYDKTDKQINEALDEIELESNDREIDLYNYLKTVPKFATYTEEQLKAKAHEMMLKDIRNSFAHGNFKINYNVHTKKLYFVLLPERRGVPVNTPIVISKNSLYKANVKSLTNTAKKYKSFTPTALSDMVKTNLNAPLQSLMMPSSLMKLADHYLGKQNLHGQKLTIDQKRARYIEFALLISQITYEQDDYYKIFGKNSNIFNKIAMVRNAHAHNNLVFGSLANRITYMDRDKTLDESFRKSITSLLIANQLKTDILPLVEEGRNMEAVEDLKNQLLQAFDYFFTDNGGCMLDGIRKFVQEHHDEFV